MCCAGIGFYHPIVIHFAIGLLTVGVLFRWMSLVRRSGFGSAAAILILLGTVATVVAARSGEDAHDAVEAVPGAGGAVRAHQKWGERTRNLALGVGALELLAFALRARPGARWVVFASAGVGFVAVLSILETGKLGGELVYAHAGGVGVRSGDPEDVARLLLAGLYQQADLDEKAGRSEEAANLLEIAARRFPAQAAVQVRAAEALLEDRKDAAGALAILAWVAPGPDEPSLRFRQGWLTADALDVLGRHAEARDALERLRGEFPENARLRGRLARTDGSQTTNHYQ